MIWEDEGWTKAQAWGCPYHPKTYPRNTSVKAWGCPRHPLLHQQKYQVSFKTLYFYSFTWYVLFLERHFILFSVLFCLLAGNKWLDPSILCLERNTLRFHCLEHSTFLSYCSVSVQFLLLLRLALVFHSYYVQSLLACLVYIWLALCSLMNICYESCFKQVDWCWRRIKYFMLIVVQ